MTDEINLEDLQSYTVKINDLIKDITYYKEENKKLKILLIELNKYKDT